MSDYIENLRFYPDTVSGGSYLVTGFPGRLLRPLLHTLDDDPISEIANVDIPIHDDFFIFRNGIGCAPRIYSPEGARIDWSIVRHLYEKEHATIYLRALQRYIPAVKACLKELARDLPKTKMFANLFLTPPNSIGLKPHIDPTEFFVIQLKGTKTWNFWRQPTFDEVRALPVKERAAFALHVANTEDKTDIVELRAGQVMYVPRFKIHGPVSTETQSSHLTVGLASEAMKDLYD